MAKTCIHISIYIGLSLGARDEYVCPIWTIPYAGDADADAFCRVWYTGSKDECTGAEVVPSSASHRGNGMFVLELV